MSGRQPPGMAGRRVRVRATAGGAPTAVWSRGGWVQVAAVADRWTVETGWWRDGRDGPISRAVWRVGLSDGRCADLAEDRLRGGWRCLRTWG